MLAKKYRLNLSQSLNQQLFKFGQAEVFQTPHLRFLLRRQFPSSSITKSITKIAAVVPRKVMIKASRRVALRRQLYELLEQSLKAYFHPTSPRQPHFELIIILKKPVTSSEQLKEELQLGLNHYALI